jgi:hypothetical protein
LIHRCSSRRSLWKDSLATRLHGARRYDRIARFFSSSLLEVAGEALEREIDRLVYELYGLMEEEIAIVEGKS